MKIGILTGYSPEVLKFAKNAGFGSLQLSTGPGSSLDAEVLLKDPGKAEAICLDIEKSGLEISAFGYYPNHLDPVLSIRESHFDYFGKIIDLCALMGVKVVCTFAGRVPDKGIEENIPLFKEIWSPHAEHAEKKGVKIGFENCSMMDRFPFHGINIAYCPEAWDMMFDAVPSKALGLEMDPSHLYWQQIDYLWAVHRYGDRIYHVHAKDTEVFWDVLKKRGIYSKGHGWWRHRIPGWGGINWRDFISALIDVGYDGNLDIEHEDPVFSGERKEEGLILGLKHLSQFVF